MPSRIHLLNEADRWANSQPFLTLPELRAMCASEDTAMRVKAMRVMQNQTQPTFPKGYFDLAERMIPDRVNTCRWQALITIGAYIERRPEEVWRIVEKYAPFNDDDMRTALAVLLLEHLLEFDFSKYFGRLKRRIVAAQDPLADVLRRCDVSRQSGKRQCVKLLLATLDYRPTNSASMIEKVRAEHSAKPRED